MATITKRIETAVENCNVPAITFIKLNFQFRTIREQKNDPGFSQTIGEMFSRVGFLSGIQNQTANEFKNDIFNALITQFDDLTIEEIYKAFELDRFGVYGNRTEHYQQFNAVYVCEILKKYKTWKHETRIANNIDKPKPEPIKPDPEQTKKIMDDAIKRHYDFYIKNGVVDFLCSHVFDEIYERRLFPASTDYAAFYQAAKAAVIFELKNTKPGSVADVSKTREILDEIQKTDRHEKIVAAAKRLVLADYFEQIKNNKLNLNL